MFRNCNARKLCARATIDGRNGSAVHSPFAPRPGRGRVVLSPRPRSIAARPQAMPRGSMYAVIETGGKQYRVEVGTELEVELLDVEPGASMKFDRVLLVADGETAAIGRPIVTNAEVAA